MSWLVNVGYVSAVTWHAIYVRESCNDHIERRVLVWWWSYGLQGLRVVLNERWLAPGEDRMCGNSDDVGRGDI